jgi:hypothetical protein
VLEPWQREIAGDLLIPDVVELVVLMSKGGGKTTFMAPLTAPVKAGVDEAMGDLASLEHIVVVRHAGLDVPMHSRRDVF